MWFDLMDYYGDFGDFLFIVFLISIIFYFVISLDSGLLVIDCFFVNGDFDFFIF